MISGVADDPRPPNAASRANNKEFWNMFWKVPKIVELPVGMEINMYACATRNSLVPSDNTDRKQGLIA
jgi:coenzyme PQQ precursor peptide PqqA